MKRYWLIFSQTATVLLAVYFVVATLRPEWLRRAPTVASVVQVFESSDTAARTDAGNGYSQAARLASPAVVSISTSKAPLRNPHYADPWFRFFFGDQANNQPQSGLGSGVIVSPDGYILTNNHVVEGADEIAIQLSDGRKALAQVIGTDPDTDLAVLRISLADLPVITLGNSDQLQVGDVVLAIGNPFGVGQTVTSGIVSALGRTQLGINTFENFIQTDAAINPGNSGGALVDVQGRLMGINTAIYSRSGGSMGIGFAIPTSIARNVLSAIVRDGKVTRGWIGVEPQELTPEMALNFGIAPDAQGVVITGVLQDGPAAQAGIRPGDVIAAVQDKAVTSVPALLQAVAALTPDTAVMVEIWRGQERLKLPITPGRRQSATTQTQPPGR